MFVLFFHSSVQNRHIPAGEIHHLGPGSAVDFAEGCLLKRLGHTCPFPSGHQPKQQDVRRRGVEQGPVNLELIAEVLHGASSQTVLEEVLELVMEDLDAERGVILSDIQSLEILAYHGEESLKTLFPFSREVVRTVIHDGLGVVSFHDPELPDSYSVKANGLRSALCVPVLRKEKTVGILYFDTRCKANAFSEGDLKFVTEVALLMSPVLPEPPDDTKPVRRPGIY